MTVSLGAPASSGRRWYRGDCHVHSLYSTGGELTPEQLVSGARQAGLHFLATTEHNTAAAHDAWASLGSEDLLVILGQEVTTPSGHWLALGVDPGHVVDWRYDVSDDVIERHLDLVHQAGGLCVAAHPVAPYPSGTFLYPYQRFDAVEVWNGLWRSDLPWNADNEAALADWGRTLPADVHAGQWRPAIGCSDTHLEGQIGTPHIVVLADELSEPAILAGIRAGRCHTVASSDIDIHVEASTGDSRAGVGDRLDSDGRPVVVRVEVGGVRSGDVAIHTDQGMVHRQSLPPEGVGAVQWVTDAAESAFVRIEVRYEDGAMAALSNPVILG